MPEHHHRARSHWLLIALAVAAAPANLWAQDTPALLEVRVEASKDPLAVNLRPNVPTSVALSLYNPGAEELRGVTVKLVHADGERVIGQTMEIDKLVAKGKAAVSFPKAKEEKKDKEKEPAAKPDLPGLPGPPFKLQLWIEAKQPKGFETVKRDLHLLIKEPRDYMISTGKFDRAKRRVDFKVKFGDPENITGPHKSPLELELGPEFARTDNGAFSQTLNGPKQAVDLYAQDLAFLDTNIREGRVFLNIDGYARAFAYPVALTGSGDLDEVPFGQKIGARIRVPRYTKPSEKFKAFLEMDGPLSADYSVEVGLDRAGTKEQFDPIKFTGLRQQKVALSFAESGNLVCQTKVTDWEVEYNTKGVYGDLWFRISVYKKDELKTLLIPEETRPYMAAQEAGAESKRLFARMTQDESPPQNIEFVNLPKTWLTNKPLPVLVRVSLPKAHQAPLEQKVIFFQGKEPPDGKPIPKEALLGVGDFDPEKGMCAITLPGPEKDGALVLSVRFITKAGIPGVQTGTINVLDAKFALCTIKGTVAHGKDGQPGLAVILSDGEGKPKQKVKTGKKGEFVFEKVPPGSYFISSAMNFPALKGFTQVDVPEGKELIENVAVRLMAK